MPTDTNLTNFRINKMTYDQAVANAASFTKGELILTPENGTDILTLLASKQEALSYAQQQRIDANDYVVDMYTHQYDEGGTPAVLSTYIKFWSGLVIMSIRDLRDSNVGYRTITYPVPLVDTNFLSIVKTNIGESGGTPTFTMGDVFDITTTSFRHYSAGITASFIVMGFWRQLL